MIGRFQPTWGGTIVAFAMITVMASLGFWQLERLEWKTQLLARIHERMAMAPVPLPEKMEKPEEWEYRRVTMAGTFLYDHEFLIKPRTLEGKSGYHMVVPFKRASGATVFVNRGFISDDVMKQAQRPQGLIKIEGIVQMPRKAYFTPENDATHNNWYWPETQAMATSAKVSDIAPELVTIADKTPDVYPMGGRIEVNIPNDHKQYARFWFGMACVMFVIYVLRSWQPTSRQEEEEHGKLQAT